jgi:hypothetical protein
MALIACAISPYDSDTWFLSLGLGQFARLTSQEELFLVSEVILPWPTVNIESSRSTH